MCKRIKDILFPTNVLGKKKKCIKVAVPEQSGAYNYEIVWSGERLQVAWAYNVQIKTPGERRRYIDPHKEIFTNGDDDPETITIVQVNNARTWQQVSDAQLHINCTNVTKLTINGEQYI